MHSAGSSPHSTAWQLLASVLSGLSPSFSFSGINDNAAHRQRRGGVMDDTGVHQMSLGSMFHVVLITIGIIFLLGVLSGLHK
jgi:threonine/homoserine/homoserine lactone efflux protein